MVTFASVDDRIANSIGQDLAATKNSDWKDLTLWLSKDLTAIGARAIARGLTQSQIEKLRFFRGANYSYDSENVPMGLWCHVLAKCGNNAGFLYYHLREQPKLLMAAGMCYNKFDGKVNAPDVSVLVGTKRSREE